MEIIQKFGDGCFNSSADTMCYQGNEFRSGREICVKQLKEAIKNNIVMECWFSREMK